MAQRQRGELEQALLDVLWTSETPLSVAEICEHCDEPRPATTTVITVLERLRAKGIVSREKTGTDAYRYTTTREHHEHIAESMTAALANSTDRSLTLMNFTGQLSDDDKAVLRRMLESRE